MSWWQSFALGLIGVGLAGLQQAIKNPGNKKKYRDVCLTVVQAAAVIKTQFPNDPDFE